MTATALGTCLEEGSVLGLRVNTGALYIFMALDFLAGYDSPQLTQRELRVTIFTQQCVGVLSSKIESSLEFRRVFTHFSLFSFFFYDLLSACG